MDPFAFWISILQKKKMGVLKLFTSYVSPINPAPRASLGVTVNFTDEVATDWASVISAYNTAQASNLNLWFEIILPNQSDAFFVIAQPPQQLPMPEISQNELLTMEITLTVVEYKGWSTKVAF